MPGTVKQFVDYASNTANDTGENNTGSIQPILNGNPVDATNLGRPDESLRQRTEAVRNDLNDTLFLRDADRVLALSGPGKITWPGSTTVAASGIMVLSDTLWLLPMLTPGFAQAPPVPPVASAFGTLHLKRADSLNSILVTSQRHSYADGDQISVAVTAGGAFSCVLDVEVGYRRTIHIVATGATQLSTVITALNGLIPPAPDNTQLVVATLEGGALGTDLLLTTQAKQFVVGNYDGEGHALTPANLAAFFTGNPTQALAEGDTLAISFAMVSDTASTGGRRQALPENGNTAVPVGSYFNSRVRPDLLVNALPICKVVNGSLVFATGCEVAAGAVLAPLAGNASSVPYGGGPPWADGTPNPATSVENQLDKIVSDLAGATGTGKVQGAVSGLELAAATLASQLRSILAKTLGWITIADGVNYFGDFNVNAFANANLLLTAAIAALPASGGRIYLKKGVSLTNFNGATIALPAGKCVEIIGDFSRLPATPQITFAAGEGLVCSATGKLVLRNLNVSSDGAEIPVALTTSPCEVYDCYFQNTGALATSDANPFFKGTNVSDLTMERVEFATTAIPASANGNPIVLIITGTAYRVYLRKIRYSNPTGDAMGGIRIDDVRNDVVIEDYSYDCTVIDAFGAAGLSLASQDSVTDIRNRHILRYTAKGEYALSFLDGITYLDIEKMDDRTSAGTSGNISNGATGPLRFINCQIGTVSNWNGSQSDLQFRDCDFRGLTISIGSAGTDSHNKITFFKCRFFGGNFGSISIGCNLFQNLLVEDCYFTGYQNTASQNYAIFQVQGAFNNVTFMRFVRNRIDSVFNAYTGGVDTANSPRIFEVRAQSISMVECSGNVVTNASVFQTVTTASSFLLRVDTNDLTGQSPGSGQVVMHDNIVGQQAGSTSSNCGLLRMEHMTWDLLDIQRNRVWTEWNTAAGAAHAVNGFLVLALYYTGFNSNGVKKGFIFNDNEIRIENTSNADITVDAIYLQAIGVPTLQVMSFQRNAITMSTNRKWDQSTGYGLTMIGWQALTTMVCENYTCRDGTNAPGGAGTPFFSIEQGVGAYFYTPDHAPPPAVNSPWSSNCFIWRGPN